MLSHDAEPVQPKKVFLGADHAGFAAKELLKKHLIKGGYVVEDIGAKSLDDHDDYPKYAYFVATKVLGEEEGGARGILVCGSGQGMAMAANKVRGIRAAVIWNIEGATETRQDNDSNVLSLPARFIDQATLEAVADAWLLAPFSGEKRHQRRIDEVEELYG